MSKWIGHKGPYGRNLLWTNADYPGIEIRHCGHPTALWPYYVVGIEGLPTYPRLADAIAAVFLHAKPTGGLFGKENP